MIMSNTEKPMSIEEAHEELKHIYSFCKSEPYFQKAVNVAIHEMLRRIPVLPDSENDFENHETYCCPNCENYLGSTVLCTFTRYCPDCGQALNWSFWAEKLNRKEDKAALPAKVKINFFDEEELHSNCTVQILKNSVTGETSVGWWENENQ